MARRLQLRGCGGAITDGHVTITSFGDSIVGSFTATGTESTAPPSQAAITGTFKATRCID